VDSNSQLEALIALDGTFGGRFTLTSRRHIADALELPWLQHKAHEDYFRRNENV
jgi:hypothetical protein